MDRLILEIRVPPTDAYYKLLHTVRSLFSRFALFFDLFGYRLCPLVCCISSCFAVLSLAVFIDRGGESDSGEGWLPQACQVRPVSSFPFYFAALILPNLLATLISFDHLLPSPLRLMFVCQTNLLNCPSLSRPPPSPELGNVAFASSRDGWCFTLESFAKMYADYHGRTAEARVRGRGGEE